MATQGEHRVQCAAREDPTESCSCTAIEDAQLAAASRPSAAQQVRNARLNGTLKAKLFAY